jgi:hypothetical protein
VLFTLRSTLAFNLPETLPSPFEILGMLKIWLIISEFLWQELLSMNFLYFNISSTTFPPLIYTPRTLDNSFEVA